jgi:hypothetical protein
MAGDDHVMVKEYTGNNRVPKYERDAEVLALHGWVVLSAADLQERPGCLNLLGPLKNIFAPQLKLRVTYMRPAAATA